MSFGPSVEAVDDLVHISFHENGYCAYLAIATHFYVEVFGDFVEDTKTGIQAFTVGFNRIDKEIIDDKAKSSRLILTDE